MATCKSCEASILWAETENGKKVPLDSKPEKRYILKAEDAAVVVLRSTYVSHFVTCPDADSHRRKP
jgi:hypothetical protein